MKKLLAVLLLTSSTMAFAGGHGQFGHRHGHWHHSPSVGWEWVVPAVIGGVVVYQATRPPVYQPQPVIVQQPIIIQENCSPWTEVQNPDGTITRTRTCRQ